MAPTGMSLSKEEQEWQAESGARTLAEAEAIKADEGRLKRASEKAEEMKKEAMDKALALERIARFSYPTMEG